MEIVAGIGAALSNALRIEEYQARHIQELRRLQALANPASAHPDAASVTEVKLRAENTFLQQQVTAQESNIAKLHHQARSLTKCASRALELLIRSRGSSAATDPEILQLRTSLRKSGVLDPGNGDQHGKKRSAYSGAACNEVQGSAMAQPDNHPSDGGRPPLSQVPAHHAKRQKKEKMLQSPEVLCVAGPAAFNPASDVPKSPPELEVSINFGAVAEDDAHVTSLPIPLDCSNNNQHFDELFDDPMLSKPIHSLAAHAEVPPEPQATTSLIRPIGSAKSLIEPAPPVSHWMSAQPGDRRMKFVAPFTTAAATSGCARVAWDAPHAADDLTVHVRSGHDAVALVKPASVAHRPSTEQLPPTVEKPQNFIQVVRGGARDKLPGHGCKQCDEFYAALESALPQGQLPTNLCNGNHHAVDARAAVASIRDNASRHRAVFRKQDSPEDYWTTKFKD
jgi:hypothetical protein